MSKYNIDKLLISLVIGLAIASLSFFITTTKNNVQPPLGGEERLAARGFHCIVLTKNRHGFPFYYYETESNTGNCDIYIHGTSTKKLNFAIDTLVWSGFVGVLIFVISRRRSQK